MSQPCNTCKSLSHLQCPCGVVYCSKKCQTIDWHMHGLTCNPLTKRTLSKDLVRDALQLEKVWDNPLAIQRANEMYLRYGDPDTIFEGRALWTGSRMTPFLSVEVLNRIDERSNTPYPHLHIVFVTLPIRITSDRACGLSIISPGLTYDSMAMECRAGGDNLSACVAVLGVVKGYSMGAQSAEEARAKVLQYLEEARKEVQAAEEAVRRNGSYRFFGTPRTDKTLEML